MPKDKIAVTETQACSVHEWPSVKYRPIKTYYSLVAPVKIPENEDVTSFDLVTIEMGRGQAYGFVVDLTHGLIGYEQSQSNANHKPDELFPDNEIHVLFHGQIIEAPISYEPAIYFTGLELAKRHFYFLEGHGGVVVDGFVCWPEQLQIILSPKLTLTMLWMAVQQLRVGVETVRVLVPGELSSWEHWS